MMYIKPNDRLTYGKVARNFASMLAAAVALTACSWTTDSSQARRSESVPAAATESFAIPEVVITASRSGPHSGDESQQTRDPATP
jgi:hypothetical protein